MANFLLQGTYTALITPFKKDGAVDFPSFKKLIELQIKNKVDGIVVCGSTGESATLTMKEKQALFIEAVKYAKGQIKVIAGTGTNETETTLALSIIAKEVGVDGVLIVAPYYNKPSQQGLYEHYRLIAEKIGIPLIIYNVPSRTAVNILPETQLKIAESCPNVIGTKEASGDIEQMMEIIRNAPSNFSVLSGDDALTLPAISVGAKGVVSVISNYLPKKMVTMVKNALSGKFDQAMKLHYEMYELMQLNFIESNPVPVKTALALLGLTKEVFRMPLLQMSSENKSKLKSALKKAGLLK